MTGQPSLTAGLPALVGRQRELGRLRELCARDARLITLWGPGGVGKTLLARCFAAVEGRRAAGGACWCDLTEARVHADLVRSLATALRLERAAHGTLADADAIGAALAARPETVLILDNLEQVAPRARDAIETWLGAAPQHRYLVTSREPLGLRREMRLEIGPLPEAEALQLLALAARAARGVDLTREDDGAARLIVARLDRLPLAIELAAARLVLLSPAELLARLDRQLQVLRGPRGAAARQQTLEATVRWSWELLSSSEQRALALCSVFRGGFCAEAAEALIALEDGGGLERLESLRLQSLLHPVEAAGAPPRLRLYEAVREFAGERLEELGLRPRAERRHAEVILARAEDRAGALDQLALESENLLVVHERFLAAEPPLAARAALALHPLLLLRGPFAAHTSLLDALLTGRRPALPGAAESQLLAARGEVLRARGRVVEARSDIERARRLSRRHRDPRGETQALRLLGTVTVMQGRAQDALRHLRTALSRARRARDGALTALCLGDLGTALTALGRLREACAHHRMALDLHRTSGDRRLEGIQLSHLGLATHRLGVAEEALQLHEQALAIHRELQNQRYEAAELSHLAYVQHQLGRVERARQLFGEALVRCRVVCDRRLEAIVQCYLADLETDAGEGSRARALLREALGYHERSEDRPQQAAAWLHLAYSHECAGEVAEAEAALQAALALASPDQLWLRAAARAHGAALLSRQGQSTQAHRLRRQALAALRAVENPLQALAVRLLCGDEPSAADRPAVEAAARRSADVRRALRWIERSTSRELWVGPDVGWFSVGHARVDLARRGPMRRVLAALVAARLARSGEGLPWHALLEAGWPGQRVVPEAALQRVYTAVWTLRKMGLEEVLISRDDGYLLDPALPVRRWEI
jgi:predicted ATPase